MTHYYTTAQCDAALAVVTAAMELLRDDASIDYAMYVFGENFAIESLHDRIGKRYSFENRQFRTAEIELVTGSDPVGEPEECPPIRVVPTSVSIRFHPSMTWISSPVLESALHLSFGYHIDINGNRVEGNNMGASRETPRLHLFRYRALEQQTSLFPVDVEAHYLVSPAEARDAPPGLAIQIVGRSQNSQKEYRSD